MPVTGDWGKDSGSSTHEHPHVWPVRTTCSVKEVFSLHVKAIERVRCGAHNNHLNVVNCYSSLLQSLLYCKIAQLSPCLVKPPLERRHSRSNDRHILLLVKLQTANFLNFHNHHPTNQKQPQHRCELVNISMTVQLQFPHRLAAFYQLHRGAEEPLPEPSALQCTRANSQLRDSLPKH